MTGGSGNWANNSNRFKSDFNYQKKKNRKKYLKTDFILVKNMSTINRVWEYPEDKDLVTLTPNVWKTAERQVTEDPNIESRISEDAPDTDAMVTETTKKDSLKSKVTIQDKSMEKTSRSLNKNFKNGTQSKNFELQKGGTDKLGSTPDSDSEGNNSETKRELIKTCYLKPFEGKKHGFYNLVLNVNELSVKKDDKYQFFVRIFANKDIEVDELAETHELPVKGFWEETSCGGPLKTNDKGKLVSNPYWCMNPQFFMHISRTTRLKIGNRFMLFLIAFLDVFFKYNQLRFECNCD